LLQAAQVGVHHLAVPGEGEDQGDGVLGVLFTENIEAIRHFLQDLLHVNLFSAEIYFFTRIPAQLNAREVASVVLMALALSFLATLYPSWRAARLDPVEGLRYQ